MRDWDAWRTQWLIEINDELGYDLFDKNSPVVTILCSLAVSSAPGSADLLCEEQIRADNIIPFISPFDRGVPHA